MGPGPPERVTHELDVSRAGLLDHAQRTALRLGIRQLYPAIPDEQLQLATTLGDLHHLAEANTQTEGRALVRSEYRTARVTLRPIRTADIPLLYEAALEPSSAFRWRFRGATPGMEQFAANLFANVEVQFVAVHSTTGEVMGLLTAYSADLQNGHCRFAFQRVGSSPEGGELTEALLPFISYLFDHFPFRKIFAELPEYNDYLVNKLIDGNLVQLEGRLTEYYFYSDRYWDLLYLSISRHAWTEFTAAITPPTHNPD